VVSSATLALVFSGGGRGSCGFLVRRSRERWLVSLAPRSAPCATAPALGSTTPAGRGTVAERGAPRGRSTGRRSATRSRRGAWGTRGAAWRSTRATSLTGHQRRSGAGHGRHCGCAGRHGRVRVRRHGHRREDRHGRSDHPRSPPGWTGAALVASPGAQTLGAPGALARLRRDRPRP